MLAHTAFGQSNFGTSTLDDRRFRLHVVPPRPMCVALFVGSRLGKVQPNATFTLFQAVLRNSIFQKYRFLPRSEATVPTRFRPRRMIPTEAIGLREVIPQPNMVNPVTQYSHQLKTKTNKDPRRISHHDQLLRNSNKHEAIQQHKAEKKEQWSSKKKNRKTVRHDDTARGGRGMRIKNMATCRCASGIRGTHQIRKTITRTTTTNTKGSKKRKSESTAAAIPEECKMIAQRAQIQRTTERSRKMHIGCNPRHGGQRRAKYHAHQKKFERFRAFLELPRRFDSEFCR